MTSSSYRTPATLAENRRGATLSIHELLREERAITPLMALRLFRLFGNSAAFWLNAQQARDLWESERRSQADLMRIQPLAVPA
jgi:addiction module HigA family antidote